MTVLTDESMMRAACVMREAADRMERSMMRLDQIDRQLERFELAIERLIQVVSSDEG